jgi:sulfur-oxidizing protein SoxA
VVKPGVIATIRRRFSVLLIAAFGSAAGLLQSAEIPRDKRLSGYAMMTPATQSMQDDELTNPASLWLLDGEALWATKAGSAARSCADCHGDVADSMRGVAARNPAHDAVRKSAINLEGRINRCRTERQNATALAYESKDLLALTMLVARQSKAMPIAIDAQALAAEITAGRAIWERRQGQLNLSCAQCHDDNWGRKLAGNTIPQGHPTGYPLYRLEWQNVGSLHRRLRNCLTGMRAETATAGSPELIALEAYLMWRADGMPIESPAVRP